MYAAIDALADKLDRQVLKHKEKRNGHRPVAATGTAVTRRERARNNAPRPAPVNCIRPSSRAAAAAVFRRALHTSMILPAA